MQAVILSTLSNISLSNSSVDDLPQEAVSLGLNFNKEDGDEAAANSDDNDKSLNNTGEENLNQSVAPLQSAKPKPAPSKQSSGAERRGRPTPPHGIKSRELKQSSMSSKEVPDTR